VLSIGYHHPIVAWEMHRISNHQLGKPLGLVPKTAGKPLHPRAKMITTAGMSATDRTYRNEKYDKMVQNSSEFLYVVLDNENLLDSIG
jgi:hypothetical protein